MIQSNSTSKRKGKIISTIHGQFLKQPGAGISAVQSQCVESVNSIDHNHLLTNLTGSFVNLIDLRIAHELLDRVLTIETISTKDLNSVCCCFVSLICSKAFCHRGKIGVRNLLFFCSITQSITYSSIHINRRFVSCQSSKLQMHCHIGKKKLHGLMLKMTERLLKMITITLAI